MRVVGYVRVSTGKQVNEGLSPENQRFKLIGYAKLYDLDLIKVEEDPGESAKSLDRPAVQRVLEMLDAGEVEGVIVAKLDRLTRSLGDWSYLIDRYFGERAKVPRRLFSVADAIDTRTATGRLVLNMVMTIAQWEREIIAERTRDALQHKIRIGQRVGKVLFGRDLGPDGKSLTPNAFELRTVATMAAMRELGAPLRAIAAALKAAGIPTKEGNADWHPDTIAKILKRYATHDQDQAEAPAA